MTSSSEGLTGPFLTKARAQHESGTSEYPYRKTKSSLVSQQKNWTFFAPPKERNASVKIIDLGFSSGWITVP